MLTLLTTRAALAASPPPAVAPSADAGRRVYRAHCAACHGVLGDGQGPAARDLPSTPPPRDFRMAQFKWRSTPTGELPTDDDLLRTISRGVDGTWMPGWSGWLSERDMRNVIAYLKTFSEFWDIDEPAKPYPIGQPPPPTEAVITRGREIYERLRCAKCHGESGRGDGPAAASLEDYRRRPILAFDFTHGMYRGGSAPRDLYRTLMTGLTGTPMPAFDDVVEPVDRWALVHYTLSLNRPRGWLGWLFDPLEETR